MQAVLMAGGKGTRLRPYTAVLPKPRVPIGETSIIEMVLRQLHFHGFERITISVGYKAELIMAVVGDGKRFGMEVEYHKEDAPRGTAGALAEIEGLEENFLVMNGDICTNMNFKEIYDDHVASSAQATIGTYRRREKIELGVLELDETGSFLAGFREKPEYDFSVAMGVNALNRSVVNLIPQGAYFGFDMLLLKMLEQKIRVRCHRFSGRWLDGGRPDDYDRMCVEFQENPGVYLPDGS